jgi:hypothetical protein
MRVIARSRKRSTTIAMIHTVATPKPLCHSDRESAAVCGKRESAHVTPMNQARTRSHWSNVTSAVK